MANTVKANTKKTTTVAKKVAKKPTTVTKKVVTKKKAKPTVAASTKSPFMEAKITQESLYWVIFGTVAILFAMWIYTLDSRIRDLYDQIDASTYSTDVMLESQMKKEKAKTVDTVTE